MIIRTGMCHLTNAFHFRCPNHGQFHERRIHDVGFQSSGLTLLVGELYDLNGLFVIEISSNFKTMGCYVCIRFCLGHRFCTFPCPLGNFDLRRPLTSRDIAFIVAWRDEIEHPIIVSFCGKERTATNGLDSSIVDSCPIVAGIRHLLDHPANIDIWFFGHVDVIISGGQCSGVVLLSDKSEVVVSVGAKPRTFRTLAVQFLFISESRFGGTEHGSLRKGSFHSQGLQSFGLPNIVNVLHYLTSLSIVKHTTNSSGLLKGGNGKGNEAE